MYGIINKSIEELVKDNFGEQQWDAVKKRSGIDIDIFLINESYDDDITFKLADAVAYETQMPLNEVFKIFGEWWILNTSQKHYGSLIEAGGSNLKDFLIKLPAFHSRMAFYFPKLTSPEFKVSDIEESSINIHYLSMRPGLKDFVKGLLYGLGKLFGVPVIIELLPNVDEENYSEIFKVSW
jgi:hypothetical protein